MIAIRPAVPEDCTAVVSLLREHELRWQVEMEDLLREGIKASVESFTATVDEEPGAMWGVIQKSVIGSTDLWMVTTKWVDVYPKEFVWASRDYCRSAAQRFGTIHAFTVDDFPKAQRWLKFIGFVPVSQDGKIIKYEMSYGH